MIEHFILTFDGLYLKAKYIVVDDDNETKSNFRFVWCIVYKPCKHFIRTASNPVLEYTIMTILYALKVSPGGSMLMDMLIFKIFMISLLLLILCF